MIDEDFLPRFFEQFDNLISIVTESNNRIISQDPDELFVNFVNVFTKSYIVSACSILEAFIQELAFVYSTIIEDRISSSNIPRNIVVWSINNESKKDQFKFEKFSTNFDREKFSEIVSANVEKTIRAFKYIGVDVDSDNSFRLHKDFISAFVKKRNNIVHHNDDAVDVSLSDVVDSIHKIKLYCSCIFSIVKSNAHLTLPAE